VYFHKIVILIVLLVLILLAMDVTLNISGDWQILLVKIVPNAQIIVSFVIQLLAWDVYLDLDLLLIQPLAKVMLYLDQAQV